MNIEGIIRTLDDIGHTGIEMVFSSMFDYTFTDILNHYGKFIASYMWVRINKDRRVSTEKDQLMQDFTDISSFRRTGVQFSVRERTGSSFSETVVRIRVHCTFPGELCHVIFTGMNILASFQNHRLEAAHKKFECSKHTCRTCTYDDDRLGFRHALVFIKDEFRHDLVRLVYLKPVTVKYICACIDGTTHDAVFHLSLGLRRHSKGLYSCILDFFFRKFLAQLAGNLYLFHKMVVV